jgi:urea transporter
MSSDTTATAGAETAPATAVPIPIPLLVVFRGIGQVFFQENALSGLLMAVAIALYSPLQAGGLIVGSAIGASLAWLLKFDKSEVTAGIYGFNPALVGIATFFFFQPSGGSIGLMLGGCLLATLATWLARSHVPFPTYTAPFVVVTWVIFFLGQAWTIERSDPSAAGLVPTVALGYVVDSIAHGIGQVMFQATIWGGLLFLLGIGMNDWKHAAWVLVGSAVGMLVVNYHLDVSDRALDPEQLIERFQNENIWLGLYGYNATLAAVALFLWRPSVIAPLLGMLFTVPLTELVPRLGLPALTAPFVLATWIVLALGCVEGRLFPKPSASSS